MLFYSPDAKKINYNIVYQYTYNGNDYLEETEYYHEEDIPNIGDIHNIYICPDNPSFIYNSKIKAFPFLIIMGILFILSGLFAIYAVLFL